MGGQAGQADAGSGGGGILLQKHVVSSNTFTDITTNNVWTTILTQEVTVAGATDRVYIEAALMMRATTTTFTCDLRIARDGTAVATAEGDIGFNSEIQNIHIRGIDTPGVGTYTYTVQAQRVNPNDCEINPTGTTSFGAVEVLSANP